MSSIEKTLERIEKRLTKLEEKFLSSGTARSAEEKGKVVEKKTSVREFLQKVPATKLMEKVVVMVYFCEKYLGKSYFNVELLLDLYRQAKEPPPKNLHDMVNKNIMKGFLMEVTSETEEKGKVWTITRTGEEYVEELLGGNDDREG